MILLILAINNSTNETCGALRERTRLKHVSPRAAARALKRVSACGPIGLSASSNLVENQKKIKNKKEKREAHVLRGIVLDD